jgi:IS5 family transposase
VFFSGLLTHPSPVDRARNGSKHHLLIDASGIPLAISLTGGNRNDVTQLLPLLDALHARPVAGKVGRPRGKPDRVLSDRGYGHDRYRRLLWARGIKPIIAHLHNFRRLRIRYERQPEIHIAFLTLACAILCWRRLDSL